MGNRHDYITGKIVWVCGQLDRKGFGANHDGNVSARFEDVLLATPTSESKGLITPEMILTLDMDGKKIKGPGKPFSEVGLHLAAYRVRQDVMAVVHAHPPFATARGLLGLAIKPALPEAIVSIGDVIPITKYITPGSSENDSIISEMLGITHVFMMAGNGVLAVGDNLEQAYLRLELVEHLAKIDYYASTMGRPMRLPETDLTKLLEKRASAGLDPKTQVVINKSEIIKEKSGDTVDGLKDIIASEIKKILQGN